eukprot:Blabericola_migrator_1__3012@NODE_1875_length_3617_cov_24_514366_g1200_i0_p1_GENE_NODE_1875_length_3617_cov_24_514366_g1200_i0NODE_1875_length_3617_cov_24_514366_g1200_i0_p1_ORF_typecomplete_len739_score59_73_NODE_1875_length_3617_cov_24_514366_g1200_i010413257
MKYLQTSKEERSTSTWKAISKCITLLSIRPQADEYFIEQSSRLCDVQGHSSHTLSPGLRISFGQSQPEYSQRVALKRGGLSLTQSEAPQEKRMRSSATYVESLRQTLDEVFITAPARPREDSMSAPHSLEASESRSDEAQSRLHKPCIVSPPVKQVAFAFTPPSENSGFDLRAENVPNMLGNAASEASCSKDGSVNSTWLVGDMGLQTFRFPKDPRQLKEYMIRLYRSLPIVEWRVKNEQSEKLESSCRTTTTRKFCVIRRHFRYHIPPNFRHCVRSVAPQIDDEVRKLVQRVPPDRSALPEYTHQSVSADAEGNAWQCIDSRAFAVPRLKDFSRFAAKCLILLGGFWTPIMPKIPDCAEHAAETLWPAGAYETQCLHEALDLIAQRDQEALLSTPHWYKMPDSYLEAHPCFLLLAMHAPKCQGEPPQPPNIQMIHLLAWIDNLWKVMKYVEAGKRGVLPPFPGIDVPGIGRGSFRRLLSEKEMDVRVADLIKFYSEHLPTPTGDLMTCKKEILNKVRDTPYKKCTRGSKPRRNPISHVGDSVLSTWWDFREQFPSILSFDIRGFIALLVHHLDEKKGLNEYSRYLGDFLAQVLTWWNHRTFTTNSDTMYQLTSSAMKSAGRLDDRIPMAQQFLHEFCEKYGITEALVESSGQECRTLSDQFLEADIEFFKFLDCDARYSTTQYSRRGILQRCLAYATAIYEKRNALNASKLTRVSEAAQAPSGQGSETDLQDFVTSQ